MDGKTSKKALHRTISNDKTDFEWKYLRSKNVTRSGHIAFYMKYTLFVAGGMNKERALSNCEYYDFQDDNWFNVEYHLTYPQSNASYCINKDGSFAIIMGGYCVRGYVVFMTKYLIIFTPQDGFKLLGSVSLKHDRSSLESVTI